MATPKRRRSDRSGRAKLRSPGRPPVARREERQRFWAAIARGCYAETAAVEVGVAPAVGVRWFRVTGGMPPTHIAPSAPPLSGRFLSFAEREQLAVLRAQGHGVRSCARHLQRAPSTISASCAGMPRLAAARSITARRRHNGTLIAPHAGRSRRSWRRTSVCGSMYKTGWPVSSPRRMVPSCTVRRCTGRVAVMVAGSIGAGAARGALSRSRGDCLSSFPTIRRCESATKPSTKRSTCRAAAHSGVS